MDYMARLEEFLAPFVNNVWVYAISMIASWLLGGLDKALLSLFVLNAIDLVVYFLSKGNRKGVLVSKFKIYLVLILGVIVDRVFGFDSNENIRLRNYLVFAYSYNEVVNVLQMLALDDNFYIPHRMRKYIKDLEIKVDDKE
ncbi:MAG: phage holin family protein [Cetobacterium sp.]